MARSVDEIEQMHFPPDIHLEGDRSRLDGDSPLSLKIHGVEKLVAGPILVHGSGMLHQPVGQGGFPMVDVGDDGKVPYSVEGEFFAHAVPWGTRLSKAVLRRVMAMQR